MFEARIRLELAQGVLLGEKDAHRILGDLLEESGDVGLAQWARSRKSGVSKRLDFVLAVLPHRFALMLGCDFIAAASSQYSVAETIISTLRLIRDWVIQTDLDPENAPEDIRFNLFAGIDWPEYDPDNGDPDYADLKAATSCLNLFEEAVRWAEKTFKAEREFDLGGQKNGANETSNHVRRMRRLIPNYLNVIMDMGTNVNRSRSHKWWVFAELNESDFHPRLAEIAHWEIQHTQRWITKMLTSEDSAVQ